MRLGYNSSCREGNRQKTRDWVAKQKNLPSVSHKREPSIKEEGTFDPTAPAPKRMTKAVKQKDRKGEEKWKRNMKIYWNGIGSAFSGVPIPLQYAHIKRHESPADHFLANGLPLTPTEHFLYDHGYIRVTADYIIEVCEELKVIPVYAQLHGRLLRLPEDKTYWPEARTLALHDKQSKWRGKESHASTDQQEGLREDRSSDESAVTNGSAIVDTDEHSDDSDGEGC